MDRLLLALAVSLASVGSARADILGITATELVLIDSADPADVTVIGPLQLPEGVVPINLTYHPGLRRLFAIGYARSDDVTTDQYLIQIDPYTAASEITGTIGVPSAVGIFEALEYVASLDCLVASRAEGAEGITNQLVRLDLDGTQSDLTTTNIDNDFCAYDPTRDLFYTDDPNGPAQLRLVSLVDGTWSDLGDIPATLGELAYSRFHDALFAVDFSNSGFYRVTTTDGGGPITVTPIGSIAGDPVIGIASVPLPRSFRKQ